MQLSSLWHTHLNHMWPEFDWRVMGCHRETVLSRRLSRFQLTQRFKVSSGSHLQRSESGAKSFSFSHGSWWGELPWHISLRGKFSHPPLHFHCHTEPQYIVGKLSWKRQYLTRILSKQRSQLENDQYPDVITPNLALTKTVLRSKYRMFR